uniref:Uncharacterized protein n=1 Tax=Anguilla anguilla TaxID=7936 RepID=A0A0E9TXE5_ANGAN
MHVGMDYKDYILFVSIFTEHSSESGICWYFSKNVHSCILTTYL